MLAHVSKRGPWIKLPVLYGNPAAPHEHMQKGYPNMALLVTAKCKMVSQEIVAPEIVVFY